MMNDASGTLAGYKDGEFFQGIYVLISRNRWKLPAVGAMIGMAGGITSIILGSLFTTISWFSGPGRASVYLHRLGTIPFFFAIPLLIISAYYLDLLEDNPHTVSSSRHLPRVDLEIHNYSNHSKQRKGHFRIVAIGAPFLASLLFGFQSSATAQQTLFNVPSTDILDQGKVYVELDIPFRVAGPRFSSYVPRLVVGAGRRIEFGLNVTGNIQPGRDTTTLVPGIKWKPYDGGRNGWAFVIGNNIFIPVRHKTSNVGNYAYAGLSKTFRTKTRLTTGFYHFSENVVAPNAQRAGGQFGFEHPVTKKLSIQADWFTGKHANGYFTPGVAYKLARKMTGYFGYSLGNKNLTNGNHFLYGEIGFNFN